MGRIYAGALGLIGFATIVCRGLFAGAGPDATLMRAIAGLAAFSAIGYIAGSLAEYIVVDAVRARVAAEIAAEELAQSSSTTNNKSPQSPARSAA